MQTCVLHLECLQMAQLALTPTGAPYFYTRDEALSAALALGAASFGGPLSTGESALVDSFSQPSSSDLAALRDAIIRGEDPLGEALCRTSSLEERRDAGMFYTPQPIVESMVRWAVAQAPGRIVDAGCGSGRFAAEIARQADSVAIVAVDTDPAATLVCRANLRVLGARYVVVLNNDYLSLALPRVPCRTVFVGNPPYVRHHRLSQEQKRRAKAMASALGASFSGLSGLQVHFFLATLALSSPGDKGTFITSSEWLDVGYGAGLRSLLLKDLGLTEIQLFNRDSWTFDDAMTTAVITSFEVGRKVDSVSVAQWSPEACGSFALSDIGVDTLSHSRRWSRLLYEPAATDDRVYPGLVRLGTLLRVSRGVATGSNAFFVMKRAEANAARLGPYVHPVLHEARQIFQSQGLLLDQDTDRVLLDPPASIDLDDEEHEPLREYLKRGLEGRVDKTYLSSHRRQWWRLGSKVPPIVATYMARQPPAFALNPQGLRIVNVIHGLYPKVPLDAQQLKGLVRYLNANRLSFKGMGRTYQGGLEKFEPSEMEALPIPPSAELRMFADD